MVFGISFFPPPKTYLLSIRDYSMGYRSVRGRDPPSKERQALRAMVSARRDIPGTGVCFRLFP